MVRVQGALEQLPAGDSQSQQDIGMALALVQSAIDLAEIQQRLESLIRGNARRVGVDVDTMMA